MASLSLLLALLSLSIAVSALDNGLARTPPMGWSTWNLYKTSINETLILDSARAIKAAGLLDLGYEYINLDDGWQAGARDPGTQAPLADPVRFPSGFKDLTDELHAMGFKAGIYSSAGTMTCAHYFGSLDLEKIDAQAYADWGFDALKYDNCFNQGRAGTQKLSYDRYATMTAALNATGRPILYQLCKWGEDSPCQFASTIVNTYRVTPDVTDSFDWHDDRCSTCGDFPCTHYGLKCSVMRVADQAASVIHKGYPGSWPDLDSLEVGVGGLTTDEEIAHMSLWSLVKSPLILGNDITRLDDDVHRIISNKHVIAINKDPLGKPGYRVWKRSYPGGNMQLWKGNLVNRSYAMLLINATPDKQRVHLRLDEFFHDEKRAYAGGAFDLQDLWNDDVRFDNVRHSLEIEVPTKGARLFEVHEASRSTIEEPVPAFAVMQDD